MVKMNKYNFLQRYKQQENNLNHNIQFEIDKPNHLWNEQTDHKMVEYMRGQLSIIREVINYLETGNQYIDINRDNKTIDYILGKEVLNQ